MLDDRYKPHAHDAQRRFFESPPRPVIHVGGYMPFVKTDRRLIEAAFNISRKILEKYDTAENE